VKKKRLFKGWYPISFAGGLVASLYASVPVYIVYIDSLGLLAPATRVFAIGGIVFVTGCLELARRRKHKLFSRYSPEDPRSGFTLLELLVVISIIGILSAIIFPTISLSRNAAYVSRTKAEVKSIATALEMYANANKGAYPPDADRNMPPGIEAYISGTHWPQAPWPGSIYDWDAWTPSTLTHDPKQPVYQLSIRFCPLNQPTLCNFPNESWAQNFDYYSSVYYCLSGPCRSHSSQPVNHPGYCLNC